MTDQNPKHRSTAWKQANPERYREYMRKYMRERRKKTLTPAEVDRLMNEAQ